MVDTSYKRNMQSWFSVEVCNPMVLAFEYSDTKWTGSQQQTENLMSMSTNMWPQSMINAFPLLAHEEA